ncbi:hypothetical protein GE061_003225 [Apolygus lucorum]|uniref:Uncharacterized protein n=1 Tax=Apolygus lucorum TaxID=248454 RepID=A0A8S9X0X0_APOLU|nr:hypothetical protein GE061_003225 [Apolygus lucorum]
MERPSPLRPMDSKSVASRLMTSDGLSRVGDHHKKKAGRTTSKLSQMTDTTRITQSSGGTPSRSARFLYLSSLLGRASVVLRPHPRNMVESLKMMADEVPCLPSVKTALMEHVDEIEKVVMSNRKAGAMMNKTMMYWRMLLKSRSVDEKEIMNMIDYVNDKMDRIKFKLNMSEEAIILNQFATARLFQCYLHDGLRIIIFDSNEDIKGYIDSAKRMRKTLRKLQKKVNSSEYFDNVKEWVMDAVVKCYVIMAVDTVSALKLQPALKDLVKNVRDGNAIETQFVNRLRAFNVKLYLAMIDAKQRRCQTLFPLDEIMTKMRGLDDLVKSKKDPSEDNPMDYLTLLDQEPEDAEEMVQEPVKPSQKMVFCDPVVLRNTYKKINPPELYPLFV